MAGALFLLFGLAGLGAEACPAALAVGQPGSEWLLAPLASELSSGSHDRLQVVGYSVGGEGTGCQWVAVFVQNSKCP